MEKKPFRLAGKTAEGAAWLVGSRLATKVLDFLSLLVMARLLSPADFGIVAIAVPIIQIIEAILEMPVGQVLVTQPTIEKRHLDTAFTLSALRGTALAIVSLLIALPFSYIYNDTRLLEIFPFLGLAPTVRGLASPQLAVLAKAMDYRPSFIIEVAGKFGSLILCCLAAVIFGDYRAIIVGSIASPAISTITSYLLAPFLPKFSLKEWPAFAHFLGWTTGTQALAALNWQIDRLILARYVSQSELGTFSLANDLSYLPEQALIKPIMSPLMSAFVSVRHDKERLAFVYSVAAVCVLGLGLPVMLQLSLLAEPAVRLALGGKWLATTPYLQLLALTLIPYLFCVPLTSLAMTLGRPEVALYQLLVESAVKIPLICLGAIFFGTHGVIFARGISAVVAALSGMYFVRQLIGIGMLEQMTSSLRVITGAVVMAATILMLRPALDGASLWQLAALLPLIAGLGLIVYCLSVFIIWYLVGSPRGVETHVIGSLKRLKGLATG